MSIELAHNARLDLPLEDGRPKKEAALAEPTLLPGVVLGGTCIFGCAKPGKVAKISYVLPAAIKLQKNRYLRHFSSWRPISRMSCRDVCRVKGRGRLSSWIPASSGVRSPFWLLHW